jgi:hypothetical protein
MVEGGKSRAWGVWGAAWCGGREGEGNVLGRGLRGEDWVLEGGRE